VEEVCSFLFETFLIWQVGSLFLQEATMSVGSHCMIEGHFFEFILVVPQVKSGRKTIKINLAGS